MNLPFLWQTACNSFSLSGDFLIPVRNKTRMNWLDSSSFLCLDPAPVLGRLFFLRLLTCGDTVARQTRILTHRVSGRRRRRRCWCYG